jgi:hypothetical protein
MCILPAMEAATHPQHHHHHEMPTSGGALTQVAISATLHCLTGCAIGEIAGLAIGTALGFSNLGTIALAIALAFLFGYGLTSLPLLRAGLALSVVVPIAFASDTLSIATMELVDNALVVAIPGAMDAGLGDLLFWGSLSFALVIAGAFAVPVNRYLIGRGKGHAVVHETGIHGGPSPRLVGIVAAVAFVFGSAVLVAEVVNPDPEMGHGGAMAEKPDPVRGLATSTDGLTLRPLVTDFPRRKASEFSFQVTGKDGRPVRDFEVEHEKPMHLIVVRRDMEGFQHLHPRMAADGTWSTPLELDQAGSYRVFADFKQDGEQRTLASDLTVDGPVDWRALPEPAHVGTRADGYPVRLDPGEEGASFAVSRDGRPVQTEPYLGAGGHLVALREGDLAFLHTHPSEQGEGPVEFETEFPSAGRYRLFLQFKYQGRVHTAAFTRAVAR